MKKLIEKSFEKNVEKIFPRIKLVDLGLYLNYEKILVIADLHLGYEEMLNKEGVLVPRVNFSDIKKRLQEKIFSKVKPEKILINGDLKHEFGLISEQEWEEVIDMLRFLQKNCNDIVLVKGNHDNILGPIANWENLKIQDFFYLKEKKILFLHGHELKNFKEFNEAKLLVIGHEHPALAIKDETKSETFKCFLKGKFEKKDLVVLPSQSFVAYGTNVLTEQTLSPFLQQNLNNFEAWVVEDKPYYFGKIRNL